VRSASLRPRSRAADALAPDAVVGPGEDHRRPQHDRQFERLADLHWVIAVGAAGLFAHYCMTRAFRIADATLVVPIDFLRLPLIAVVGMIFYGEPLEFSIMLGAAVIFAGTYYSIRRESIGRA